MANFKRVVNIIPLTRVNLGSPQIFTYLVPLQLQGLLRPGQIVKIPFGKSRTAFGVISSMEMHRLPGEVKGLKNITALWNSQPWLTEKNLALINWLSEYYCSPLGVAAKAILPKPVKKAVAAPVVGYEKFNPDFVLTEAQRIALNEIISRQGSARKFLLHGPAGSGKTEVCLQVANRLLEQGKQIIYLVPEFDRLPAMREVLIRRFGVAVLAQLHSRLLGSQRLWEWQKIANEEKKIVLGTRSAVFAPVRNLGAVIISQEHRSSYKQYDQQPKYDARTVAGKLSDLWQCPVIFASATPSVGLYHQAISGQATLLPLPNRIKADLTDPVIRIASVPQDRVLSPALQVELTQVLLQKRAALLVFGKRQAGRLTDDLQELLVQEFRRDKPEVSRLSPDQILIDPIGGTAPLGMVGVTDADFYLGWTDFRAAERAFQFLRSLAERLATSGKNPGILVIQTSLPDHYVMRALKLNNYERFFEADLMARKKAGMPPFTRLVKLSAANPPFFQVLKFPPQEQISPAVILKDAPKAADVDVDPESLL